MAGMKRVIEVLPPSRGLSEKGIEIYYECLKDRFTDESFMLSITHIIETQRDFPRIADFITHTTTPMGTPEQLAMVQRLKERQNATA